MLARGEAQQSVMFHFRAILGLTDFGPRSFPYQASNDVGGGETVARVSALDKEMKQRAEDARERGKVIRYVVSVDGADGREEATAGIREVDTSHPYAGLEGAAFCVVYKTKVGRS